MASPVFVELSIILGITVLISIITHILRQPLIIGYIISGILVSPYFLDLLKSPDTIHAFGQFGIAILLFVVGLNLNPKTIKEVGKASVITGIGQIIFTFGFGILIAKGLGFSLINAAYIAIALTFSSTIIILKLLSDKHELHTLYGKVATGFLIVQDLVVVTIMLFITTAAKEGFTLNSLAVTVLELAGVFFLLFLITKYLIPKIDKYLDSAHELVLIASLAWCFALASLFFQMDFALETGALFAGIVLANSSIRHELSLKIKPLRDFFLVMFFIVLGSTLVLESVMQLLVPALILSVFVLIGNPLIVIALMYKLGYTTKTSFKAGLTVAQISEFSLILVGLGVAQGHIESHILSLITIVGLITIAASSYMILYSDALFKKVEPILRKVLRTKHHQEKMKFPEKYLVLGYGNLGKTIVSSLKRKRKKPLVIDNNPRSLQMLARQNIMGHFGDLDDPSTLDDIDLRKVKLCVSTVASYSTNAFIIDRIREANKKTIIIALANTAQKAMDLYEKGASYVLMPEFLGARRVTALVEENGIDIKKYVEHKANHIQRLQNQHVAKSKSNNAISAKAPIVTRKKKISKPTGVMQKRSVKKSPAKKKRTRK